MDAIFGIVQGTGKISGIGPSKQKATHVYEGAGWGRRGGHSATLTHFKRAHPLAGHSASGTLPDGGLSGVPAFLTYSHVRGT